MVVVKAAVITVVVAVVVMAIMVEVEEVVGETAMIGCHSLPLYTAVLWISSRNTSDE